MSRFLITMEDNRTEAQEADLVLVNEMGALTGVGGEGAAAVGHRWGYASGIWKSFHEVEDRKKAQPECDDDTCEAPLPRTKKRPRGR